MGMRPSYSASVSVHSAEFPTRSFLDIEKWTRRACRNRYNSTPGNVLCGIIDNKSVGIRISGRHRLNYGMETVDRHYDVDSVNVIFPRLHELKWDLKLNQFAPFERTLNKDNHIAIDPSILSEWFGLDAIGIKLFTTERRPFSPVKLFHIPNVRFAQLANLSEGNVNIFFPSLKRKTFTVPDAANPNNTEERLATGRYASTVEDADRRLFFNKVLESALKSVLKIVEQVSHFSALPAPLASPIFYRTNSATF